MSKLVIMDLERLLFVAIILTVFVLFAAVLVWRQRRRERDSVAARVAAIESRRHIPSSLHPVIDADVCIGSLSCVRACPEGDILGVIDDAAVLIEGAHCIGHGRCARECPVHAIRLVFGTSERGVDLPEIDEFFESGRPGVHIVGELGGMGLIRNAITQGLEVADILDERLAEMRRSRGATASDVVDIAIVGAGPAGIATAVGARAKGRSFRVLDQHRIGGTTASYPRQKIVMTEALELPIYGLFGKPVLSKEELMHTWDKVCAKAGVTVETGAKVETVEGEDGAFVVVTNRGRVAARKVVLAIGRRGSPRQLGVPGENLPKVTYSLLEPEQYEGKRMLVVGGGDSALEAAAALAHAGAADVTLSYRGDNVAKARQANQAKVKALADEGKLRLLLGSNVTAIEPGQVLIKTGERTDTLANDFVIVCAGGELPLEFLAKAGVTVKRHFGASAAGATSQRASAAHGVDRGPRYLVPLLWALGAVTIALLADAGRGYYLLDRAHQLHSPLRASLRSSGVWGHGVGVVATLFMLSNFAYAIRKHIRSLKGSAPIRSWLTVHMFVGIMSPIVIAFHAAFQSNNMLATATFTSLLLVVGAGVFGRFIYNLVPRRGGEDVDPALLAAQYARALQDIALRLAKCGEAASPVLAYAQAAKTERGSFVGWLVRLPVARLIDRAWRRRALALVAHAERPALGDAWGALIALRDQSRFGMSLRRLLSAWRIVHVCLSLVLVLIMAVHIGVALYLGYRWVLG